MCTKPRRTGWRHRARTSVAAAAAVSVAAEKGIRSGQADAATVIDCQVKLRQQRRAFLTAVKDYNFGLDWAADGKGLFTSSHLHGGAALLHVDLQGNAHVLWVLKGGLLVVGLPSPDGRRLVMEGATMNSNVWMVESF